MSIPRTEMRNPNSMNLDKMSALEIATCMNNEDKLVPLAVEKALPEIAKTIETGHALLDLLEQTYQGANGRKKHRHI